MQRGLCLVAAERPPTTSCITLNDYDYWMDNVMLLKIRQYVFAGPRHFMTWYLVDSQLAHFI